MRSPLCLAALACLGLACATLPFPHEKVTAAQASIRAAEELGADRTPAAAPFLRLARSEAQQASTMLRSGSSKKLEDVTILLERSRADAELAIALAKEAAIRTDAERIAAQARELQSR